MPAHNTKGDIDTVDDLLAMLDAWLQCDAEPSRWDGFYAQRERPCPFFVDAPDESLAAWLDEGRIGRGRALDLGCGHGRNALYLARQGFAVDAVDLSPTALAWAAERAGASGLPASAAPRWQCASVFSAALATDAYDLVVDSGCFHHLAPHRRPGYVELVRRVLKPGGHFSLTCFRPEGGSGLSDAEVYRQHSLRGGLGYTDARLRAIWSRALRVQVLRPMAKPEVDSGHFGEPFLWAMLAQRPAG